MTDRGDATKLRLREVKNEAGELVDPENLKLRILSPDGTTSDKVEPAIVRESLGNFYYVLNPSESGNYSYRWEASGNVDLAVNGRLYVSGDPFETYSEPVDGYPPLSEILGETLSETLLDLGAREQLALRAAAIAGIENETGQIFSPEGEIGKEVTKTISGSGTREILLPKRLETLTGLSAVGTSISVDSAELSEDHDRIFLTRLGAEGGSTWVERALADVRDRAFPYGADMVDVTGIWGWKEAPAAVATALRVDMEDSATIEKAPIMPTLAAWKKVGVTSLTEGPLSISFDASSRGAVPTLSPRAVGYLGGYLWQRVGELV